MAAAAAGQMIFPRNRRRIPVMMSRFNFLSDYS
jgi:hypothetical protein